MRFNLITNLQNGVGLQRDYELLSAALQQRGHEVRGVQFNAPVDVQPADINIFLETLRPELFHYAQRQWVIPNPEWWFPQYDAYLPQIEHVLCKTMDGVRLFKPLAGKKVSFLGFVSRDLDDPKVERQPRFLHVAGNSMVKNTEPILEAWGSLPYPLTLVSRLAHFRKLAQRNPQITYLERVSDGALQTLMNSHQFHLCPSKYEGFGHYLHEAQSVGAIVITIDAPPMNEFGAPAELLLPAFPERPLRLATLHGIKAQDVRDKAVKAAHLEHGVVANWSHAARTVFLYQQSVFAQNLSTVLGG